ncbi:hypothetical protein PQR66_38010 [Paraburkholderia agricolaris]|uniref:Dienelactone hydrolase domain-containing protein n=1 Tax=Paraburkholderia agricolaris TaxID=2152888 RepID=A0ABW9A2S8_9BURK
MTEISCSIGDLYGKNCCRELRGPRMPVLIHLHGAFGFSDSEVALSAIARKAGFAFFAPDSFSRKMRFSNCELNSCEIGQFPIADLYRRAELLYAVERIRDHPFIDSARLVISGFSEGGAAVAIWGGEVEAAAYVVAGWSCSAPETWGWAGGLRTPDDRPVLHIQAERDPWFLREGWQHIVGCHGPWVRELILDSDEHHVYRTAAAQNAALTFLEDIRDS